MTDLELRRQVAEALGWLHLEHHSADEFDWLEGVPPGGLIGDDGSDWDEVPAYETDIAAAWGLAEEIIAAEHDVSLINIGDEYMMRYYDRSTGRADEGDIAPHPAAAICKAWLKYKEAKR